MDPWLQTERLALRRFTPDDAALLIELDSDPAVQRYLTGGRPTPPETVRTRDLPSILAGYQRWNGDFGVFAAVERETGNFVGWFCLRPRRSGPLEEAELGYRLRQQAWGRGLATEGSRGLLRKAFGELDVRLVWGETMVANRPSQKVMVKVGMTLSGTLPTPDGMHLVEGSERGGLRYEITRDRWENGV